MVWRKGHEIKSDNCSWLWIQLNCKRIMKPSVCERWKYNLLSVFQEASIHYFRFDLFFLWYYKYMQTIVATVIHFWWRRWLLLLLVSQVRSFSWSFSGDMKRKRKKIRRAPSLLEYTTHTHTYTNDELMHHGIPCSCRRRQFVGFVGTFCVRGLRNEFIFPNAHLSHLSFSNDIIVILPSLHRHAHMLRSHTVHKCVYMEWSMPLLLLPPSSSSSSSTDCWLFSISWLFLLCCLSYVLPL